MDLYRTEQQIAAKAWFGTAWKGIIMPSNGKVMFCKGFALRGPVRRRKGIVMFGLAEAGFCTV